MNYVLKNKDNLKNTKKQCRIKHVCGLIYKCNVLNLGKQFLVVDKSYKCNFGIFAPCSFWIHYRWRLQLCKCAFYSLYKTHTKLSINDIFYITLRAITKEFRNLNLNIKTNTKAATVNSIVVLFLFQHSVIHKWWEWYEKQPRERYCTLLMMICIDWSVCVHYMVA